MDNMPTFTPSGGQPLLVRGTVQESFQDKIPSTSRYAWPTKDERAPSRAFSSRASKNPFFARHNPHPQRVRHLKGLLDIPVCTVIDSPGVEDNQDRFLVCTPTTDQMRQRPLRGLRMPINADSFVTVKEKAIPTVGLVPITFTWREELRKLAEAAGVKREVSKNPYTITKAYQMPPVSRQGSRMDDRPPPSRNGELPPPSRGGERMLPSRQMSRQGDVPPPSRQGVPPSRQGVPPYQDDRQLQHIVEYPDNEGYMLELLGSILQTDSVQAIQSWLVNAPNKEKELVLDMIRAVSSSDREFREGYNTVVRSPVYEDQLLQQEASLDVDNIQKYNEAKKREMEEEQKLKAAREEGSEKPGTPRSGSNQGYTQYQWTSPGCKPSSPFVATEKKNALVLEQNRPRPGTAEAEIEEIRSRLQSRSSPRVFQHQSRASAARPVSRPQTQQSLYIPPTEALTQNAQRPPSHQSIKSQQSVIKSILSYKPQQNA
ncbi:predicted protein [Nematostella vectensis]|uniref:Protein TBATA n=1 Tax=Nematostella vectensis TaxID=45351 RepID=A7RPP9_NEMVE|nr:protein TBATA [Nematostella vectensis]EDO46545.1 predicted protein [Nematostella vectensis]|eukprot:XP_001638608.1 predicted protein [Nematostella vectensis]